jgi:hypothetical protein
VYFGFENNRGVFCSIFDLIQKLIPAWHAGEPRMNEAEFDSSFREVVSVRI